MAALTEILVATLAQELSVKVSPEVTLQPHTRVLVVVREPLEVLVRGLPVRGALAWLLQ